MQPAFNPSLNKEDVNNFPLYKYTGEILLVRTDEERDAALERLRGESILGLDTETRPSFRKGNSYATALLQLAARDAVYIFQLAKAPLERKLAAILSDPGIIKTGVAIAEDLRYLRKLYPFNPAGIVDLSAVARKNNLTMASLRGLAACLLGLRISKNERCSNWAVPQLSPGQITYAATDAWVSRRIYLRALELGLGV
jgi:ribonuclease D